MLIIKEKINDYLLKNNLSLTQFSKIVNHSQGALSSILNGRDNCPEHVIEKLAPILGVSVEEIKSWILADKYSREILERAVKIKKEKQSDRLILTTKLDEILKSKQLSRTALSKLIDYSQGGLNEMIIGKEPMSKSVISKISVALDIPENEIKSWIAADKYSTESLEKALKVH